VVKDEDGNGAFGVSGTDSLTPLIPALNEMCLYFTCLKFGVQTTHLTDDGKMFCCVASPFLSASATRTLSTPLVQA
jgi:hypothetical protein